MLINMLKRGKTGHRFQLLQRSYAHLRHGSQSQEVDSRQGLCSLEGPSYSRLGSSKSMHGGHQAFFNAKMIQQY